MAKTTVETGEIHSFKSFGDEIHGNKRVLRSERDAERAKEG